MHDLTLVGPFWTRAETAGYLGIEPGELLGRRDVLRIGGRWLEETYPALQFDGHDVIPAVAAIVELLRDAAAGAIIADWLCRPNPALGSLAPIAWCRSGGNTRTLLQVATADAPRLGRAGADPVPLTAAG
jgi:hypothetical protein